MVRKQGIPGLLLVVVLAAAACQSAAEVFLDVEPAQPGSSAGSRLQNAAGQFAFALDTVRPPIEAVDDPDSIIVMLPRAGDGAVDWMTALRSGIIAPRSGGGARGAAGVPSGFGYDFYFGAFEAYFPHSSHVTWLACESCHPGLYRRRDESTSMAEINEGKSCGTCHGPVAFPASACERCHPALSMPADRLTPDLGVEYVFERSEEAAQDSNYGQYPPAVFSHGRHRIRNTCMACHPGTFPMEQVAPGSVTMRSIQLGESCGACHDGDTAFGVLECGRCHRPPTPAEGGASP